MKKLNSWSMVAAAAILTACSANDYVGDTPLSENKVQGSIVFEGTPAHVTNGTRAEGSTAAGLLGGEFNVYGVKNTTERSSDYSTVFDDWTVWYLGGGQESGTVSPGQEATSANYAGWEYVNETLTDKKTLPTNDYIKTDGDYLRRSVLAATSQKVRYWDKSATDYWFYAVSAPVKKGDSETNTWTWEKAGNGKISHCLINDVTDKNTILYADAINAKVSSIPSDKAVRFSFKRLMSKVRFAFYERIKGYAIKDVKFYVADENGAWKDGETGSSTNLVLKDADGNKSFVPSSGAQYKVTYADNGVASAEFVDDAQTTKSYTKEFGKLLLNRAMDGHTEAVAEYMANGVDLAEPGNEDSKYSWVVDETNSTTGTGSYLGSDNKYYWCVAPNANGEINIKVSYTMVSNDNDKDKIKKTASVTLPAASCKWEPNYGYTYKFKISGDNGDIIYFDGVVVDELFNDSMEGNFGAE